MIRSVVVIGFFCATSALRGAAPSPQQVDDAIKKGIAFVYSVQNKDGSFEPAVEDPRDKGGYTALCTYALLAAGEKAQDPRIARAVAYLLKTPIIGTYALGLRCQVWNLLSDETGGIPPANIRAARDQDGKTLLNSVGTPKDSEPGLYDYSTSATRIGPRHNSPSQYGVLGMWALEEIGFEVPLKYWDLVDRAWRKNQGHDGGWAYLPQITADNPEKASMTAAGVATLFITNDYLHSNDGLACKGNITNDNIEQGLEWMNRHFDKVGGDYYTLYGVERIGVASGYKYFGNTDWFAVGSEFVVKSQSPNGSWNGAWGVIPSSSFSLLFLSRGRAPVAMNKLDYETAVKGAPKRLVKGSTNWDQRPRDVANLVRWVGHHTEQTLNWQVVNFSASPDDLHDAPILYISGDGAFAFTDSELQTLRNFVQQGGMIVGNADCDRPLFAQAFKKLGTTLFPAYDFRELPENHIIFTGEQYQRHKWKIKPKVQALSNSVRELMLLIPESDPGRAWQARNDQTRKELYELGSNIILYCTSRERLRPKGDTYFIKDKQITPVQSLSVARIMIGDNPDPEPGGWTRLGNLFKNDEKLALTIKSTKLEPNSLDGVKLAHLTGTSAFSFTPEQREMLKAFVLKGGTLVIDAGGGNVAFATSAEKELTAMYSAAVAKKAISLPLPATDLLYNIPGHLIGSIKYRTFATQMGLSHLRGPQIVGIPIGKRIGVFYSRLDLSAGIVGEPVDGVAGYDPATATAIMQNILLYASTGGIFKPAPTTHPATAPSATSPSVPPAVTPPPAAPVAPPAAAPPATPPTAPSPADAPPATPPAATAPAAQ